MWLWRSGLGTTPVSTRAIPTPAPFLTAHPLCWLVVCCQHVLPSTWSPLTILVAVMRPRPPSARTIDRCSRRSSVDAGSPPLASSSSLLPAVTRAGSLSQQLSLNRPPRHIDRKGLPAVMAPDL